MRADLEIIPDMSLEERAIGWRLVCYSCGYRSALLARRGVELVERVHRHRHVIGRIS